MHKSENVIGVLTRIVDAKLRLCRLAECRMKITAPAPSALDRKADHQTKDLSAAQPRKKPESVHCAMLNPPASPPRAISARKARPEKGSSAPPGAINALPRRAV
jgi:hypothetical protein